MKILFMIAAACVFLAAGCSKNSSEPVGTVAGPDVIAPLATGDQWIYDVATMDSSGVISEDHLDTLRVGLASTIDGETWYLISTASKSSSASFFTNRSDGYWFFNESTRIPVMQFKYPATAGESFAKSIDTVFGTDSNFDGIKSFTKVISTDEKVTIGSKTYSCYHYQSYLYFFQNGADTIPRLPTNDDYYSPGIGKIKSIFYFNNSFNASAAPDRTVTTLKSYSLK
ncbi:MAG: hypothetical protein Q8896_07200 [Bacteroidota bacterium]|nr:hypothetical protein [Bacteroidota bacterium]MDP4236254.1 hypothetical protein [Bacteroidota bacterium]